MDTDLQVFPWTQRTDEANEWYDKFMLHYIPLGPTRTLLQAYLSYAKASATSSDQAVMVIANPPKSAPANWSTVAREMDWRKRALAYDAEQSKDLVNTMTQAKQVLQAATLDAAVALRNALSNPKFAVAAAKEILDRGGLPAVTLHAIKLMPFTADDLAQATREVEEWQRNLPQPKQLLDESG